jgi:hypothetical protein
MLNENSSEGKNERQARDGREKHADDVRVHNCDHAYCQHYPRTPVTLQGCVQRREYDGNDCSTDYFAYGTSEEDVDGMVRRK